MNRLSFHIASVLFLAIGSLAAADDSGLVVHLTFDDRAAETPGPIGGGAIELPRPDGRIVGSDADLPQGLAPGTISLWFNLPTEVSDKVLFCYGSPNPGRARGIWLLDADTLVFYKSGGPDLNADISGGITPGRWHQVVATYDGTTARLYYDGRSISELEGKYDTLLGGEYRVGFNFHNDGRDFQGMVDDVRLYNRALSTEEIRKQYAKHAETLPKFDIDWPARRAAQQAAERAAILSKMEGLGVEEIIFAVRQVDGDGHWYANFGRNIIDPNRKYYHDGGRLCRLNLATGEVKTLLEDPQGGVRDPIVHYDAHKILFSYRKGGQPFYHLYEINIDGGDLRQLTDGEYDDFEPTYLPDGGIIFCSSRCDRWVPCYFTQVAVLYRCDGDGGNIRQLSANTEQENTPWVLPDGRILYQRWEYVDRSQIGYHHLWTMNPDGTGQMIYFGNQRPDTVMIDAKPIPGTDQVIASMSPGHGLNEHRGVIARVDPDKGPDAQDMVYPLHQGGYYRDPYPLSEDLFLVAGSREILLMDSDGQRRTIYKLPAAWCTGTMEVHEPRPLRSHPRERVIPSRIDTRSATGHIVLENIYQGRNMKGIERGEIKKLLVLEILPKPYTMFSGMEPLTYGGTFLLQRVLGTVPVEPDGSAYVELPAMRPVFFVALDENEMAVKRMQSFLTVQPGEQQSCVGCHEQRVQTPRAQGTLMAAGRPPSRIQPVADVSDVLDFPRDIQPILDKHCVGCHDYEPTEQGGPMDGGILLCDDRGPMFSSSYYMLTVSGQFSNGRNLRKSNYAPRMLGSSASPLLQKLDGQHYDAQLSEHEKKTLRLWIECGAVYAGTYAALGTGSLGDYSRGGMDRRDLKWASTQAAQEVLGRRCAGCHQGSLALPNSPTDNRGMAPWNEGPMNELAQPGNHRNHPSFRFNRHLLYNLSRPDKSLQLLAPLATEAGGYGICRAKDGEISSVFTTTEDPDYQKLLTAVRDAKKYLDEIKRFDMPGYRPHANYIREMQRYGILSKDLAPDAPVDPYATDEAYWRSMWHQAK